MIHYVCRYCGCTNDRACPAGCEWVDNDANLCSACLPMATAEELAAVFNAELDSGECVAIAFTLPALTSLTAAVNLAMRHPRFPAAMHDNLEHVLREVETHLRALGFYGSAEAMRRGRDTQYDIVTTPQGG